MLLCATLTERSAWLSSDTVFSDICGFTDRLPIDDTGQAVTDAGWLRAAHPSARATVVGLPAKALRHRRRRLAGASSALAPHRSLRRRLQLRQLSAVVQF